MSKQPALTWVVGVAGVVAVGAAAWFLLRRDNTGDLVGRIENMAGQAREKTSGMAKLLKERATPLLETVGEMVEKNAELVSALANLNADQVRKTGQEIRQAAATLEKNLDALADL